MPIGVLGDGADSSSLTIAQHNSSWNISESYVNCEKARNRLDGRLFLRVRDKDIHMYERVYRRYRYFREILQLGLGALLLEHSFSNHTSLDLTSSSLGHDISKEDLLGQLELCNTFGHPGF